MKEKFDRKRPHINIEEIGKEVYNEKVKDMTPEERDEYNNYLKGRVKNLFKGRKNKEIKFDGLTIIDGGSYYNENADGEIEVVRSIKCYDEFGNSFYDNYSSVDEALDAIIRLAEEGITAVIGTPRPTVMNDGRLVSLKESGCVGIYIVGELEKKNTYSKRR